MLLSRLDARWWSTATTRPNCTEITVLGRQGSNMACVRNNCFIETFTSSPINVYKLLGTELFSLSLITSVMG